MNPAIEQLRSIKTLPQLVAYLRDELDWPISSNNTEDITFDYEPSELGLDKETAVKIKEIKQLRPLTGNQPWGIFFVNFEKKRLPVMVMRRILRSLVFKKRTAPGKADRQAWHASDLLFISAYGEEHDRAITFAHFVEDEELGGLAELRVLGWDDDDTPLKYDYVAHTLHDKFRWRGPFERDPDMWRKTWRDAFELRHREVITTSKQLALSLAALAKKIRSRVRSILRYEDGFGQIRKLQTAFRKALIHDLSDDDFADMYAQTITYGLFSARVSRPAGIRGENIIDMVPVTNPFLRDMLETFLNLSGRKGKIDFDELGIQQVTALLNHTNVEAILRDFGKLSRREDPVIHFYEDFLREYDAEKRIKRGVFYTPKPVVSYIVRSVHELLQSEFKLADGLADTTTWGEMVRKTPGLKLPNISGDPDHYQPINESEPFVQILDPAVGTATFLVEVIDVIYDHLRKKWERGGFKKMPELPATSFPRQPSDFTAYWNQYVPLSLLPRLHGFELMMAPYAIAHMKVGLKLHETHYHFGADERARVYLTNSLEPPSDIQRDLPALSPALAHEAEAVNEVKRTKRFTVVIGNPPYSKLSANWNEWIDSLLHGRDSVGRRIADYYMCDGAPLGERTVWIQDDYIKFVRLSHWILDRTGSGIHSFISNNGYLDNPTLRGMRQQLRGSFQQLHLLDLHGSTKRGEVAPDGTADENVFDIQQGVAIGTFTKWQSARPTVEHADLWGLRGTKYSVLLSCSKREIAYSEISPKPPFHLLVPSDTTHDQEYEAGWKVTDIFPLYHTGIITKRDALTIHWSKDDVFETVSTFVAMTPEAARREFELPADVRDWKVSWAQADLRKAGISKENIIPIKYRPFDRRFTYFTGRTRGFVGWPVADMTKLMLRGGNVALVTSRMTKGESFAHCLFSREMIEVICLSAKTSNNAFAFPLFVSSKEEHGSASKNALVPNFNPTFLKALRAKLSAADPTATMSLEPNETLGYIAALLHSPQYRARYVGHLSRDFPRLPLTGNLELYRALAKLGGELVALHLLESPKLDKPRTEFIGSNRTVEKVSYSKNTVWIDKAQSSGFSGVLEEVWNFRIGGYQVCEKWLKDRKGRTLSKADIAHYGKIVIALSETIRLMSEIDKVIEKHGGWPGAFDAPGREEQRAPVSAEDRRRA